MAFIKSVDYFIQPTYLLVFKINKFAYFTHKSISQKVKMKPILLNLRAIFCCLMLFMAGTSVAQTHTISGSVRDATSGESLIGATIYVAATESGTTTNNYGFYSLTLPAQDSMAVIYSYLGYEAQVKKIFFDQNYSLDIFLNPGGTELTTVEVSASRVNDDNITQTQMGVIDVPLKLVKEIPAVLGETDILKVIQLLPGVQSGNEGTTGFHVRGGNADQNLVLLDEAIVYNPNHLLGLLSTFNTSAINNVTLIKGGFPAQYGGRLSSILDITMKEGNNRAFKGDGGIGLISSRLTLEGPLAKEKSSFIVSGRRTYLDLLLRPFIPKKNKTKYNFYDLNAKVNYTLGKNDRIYFSVFNGRDNLDYERSSIAYDIGFGNTTATFRWNHLFSQKLFSNTSLIYNEYDYSIKALQNNVRSNVASGIRDLSAKMEFQYFPHHRHKIKFGAHLMHHRLQSEGDSRLNPGTQTNPELGIKKIPIKTFYELGFYADDEIQISQRFSANVGIRVPLYLGDSVDYTRVEPRIGLKIGVSDHTSIKAAYTMMNQFIHLIPGSAASVPYDIWAPSTNRTKPQKSQQYSLGLFQNFKENTFETSVEVYYKTMDNQVLFREGNQLVQSLDVDNLLVYGEGWSYGSEFFVQKSTGNFTGWLSYTLSWTKQKFSDLNFGKTFPFRYDKRHNLSVTGSYALNDRWTLSSTFVFTSGAAFTVPTGRIAAQHGGSLFEGNYYLYEERNNIRMASYHRLDISAIYKKQRKIFGKKYDSEWVFGIYNVYSRQNPYFVYFVVDVNTDEPQARQASLLPIIPSFSYNFKF